MIHRRVVLLLPLLSSCASEPPLKVADLGCGEGYLTIEASRWASRVLAVDRSTTVLKRAQALAGRRRVPDVELERLDSAKAPAPKLRHDVDLVALRHVPTLAPQSDPQ